MKKPEGSDQKKTFTEKLAALPQPLFNRWLKQLLCAVLFFFFVILITIFERSWLYGSLVLFVAYLAAPCVTLPNQYATSEIIVLPAKVIKLRPKAKRAWIQVETDTAQGNAPVRRLTLSTKETKYLEVGMTLDAYLNITQPGQILAWSVKDAAASQS